MIRVKCSLQHQAYCSSFGNKWPLVLIPLSLDSLQSRLSFHPIHTLSCSAAHIVVLSSPSPLCALCPSMIGFNCWLRLSTLPGYIPSTSCGKEVWLPDTGPLKPPELHLLLVLCKLQNSCSPSVEVLPNPGSGQAVCLYFTSTKERIVSSNKEIIKEQLKSIAKPGINATAFKMVSSPSQIEKQTVIWRTDATNDYLKICFKDDFDGMPSKIMRETIAKMFLPVPLPPTSASPPERLQTQTETLRHHTFIIFSNTIRIGSKTLPMKRGQTRVPLCIWRCLCTVAHWSEC